MDLVLYYFPSCPYCQKVLNHLDKNNINIEMKNTQQDQEAKDKLISIGGKYQVPCLFINGEPLYESEDIIKWFKNNY